MLPTKYHSRFSVLRVFSKNSPQFHSELLCLDLPPDGNSTLRFLGTFRRVLNDLCKFFEHLHLNCLIDFLIYEWPSLLMSSRSFTFQNVLTAKK